VNAQVENPTMTEEPAIGRGGRFAAWLSRGPDIASRVERQVSVQAPWHEVMWLTGVDYFSSLAYQAGIALIAAGILSETYEQGAVIGNRPKGHVPPKDFSEILIGADNMRICQLLLELHTVQLLSSNKPFLVTDGKRFPCGKVMTPLLQHQDTST
jgi:hypothetical protein